MLRAGLLLWACVCVRTCVGQVLDPNLQHAHALLAASPLIDGHNDLPEAYRDRIRNQVYEVDLTQDVTSQWGPSQTDIPRMRQGEAGAQFWSAWSKCNKQDKDAVRTGLEQVDVIHRFIAQYPSDFVHVTTADGIVEAAFADGKIGGLIGLEGGHQLDSSLAALRMFYQLGVRYVTLTHTCSTNWVNNSNEDVGNPPYFPTGLSDWGKELVREMNRIGMLVDLSHTSWGTQHDVLAITEAPVIFSHANAWELCNNDRNVHDDVLQRLQSNDGIIMVTFVNGFLSTDPAERNLERVADHIEYIRDLIGPDHIGIGGDFDGVSTPVTGLEDVSKTPYLFAELIRRGWTDLDLEKLAGQNLLRVFRRVEQVAVLKASQGVTPYDDPVPTEDLDPTNVCRTDQ